MRVVHVLTAPRGSDYEITSSRRIRIDFKSFRKFIIPCIDVSSSMADYAVSDRTKRAPRISASLPFPRRAPYTSKRFQYNLAIRFWEQTLSKSLLNSLFYFKRGNLHCRICGGNVPPYLTCYNQCHCSPYYIISYRLFCYLPSYSSPHSGYRGSPHPKSIQCSWPNSTLSRRPCSLDWLLKESSNSGNKGQPVFGKGRKIVNPRQCRFYHWSGDLFVENFTITPKKTISELPIIPGISGPMFEGEEDVLGRQSLAAWKRSSGRHKSWKLCSKVNASDTRPLKWHGKASGKARRGQTCNASAHPIPWLFLVSNERDGRQPLHVRRKNLDQRSANTRKKLGELSSEGEAVDDNQSDWHDRPTRTS